MRGKLWNYLLITGLGFLLVSSLNYPAQASDVTIDFNGMSGGDGSPFTSYSESGFQVSAISDQWLVGQSGGNFGPYIYFIAQANQVITATIAVTDGGAQFSFRSIDLYSSITTIPYTFTGFLNNSEVFSVSGIVPHTYGNFATVDNPDSSALIDTLDVSLTNDPGPCCSNPMGLDNIVLSQGGASAPEPGGLLLLGTGVAGVGLFRRRLFW
jgi:hypothetical protein